jgi:hypothetical protein
MKLPLLLAHGELLIPIFLIGLPATLIGIVFIILTAVFHSQRKDLPLDRKTKVCGALAILMCGIALFSPMMLPLIDWALQSLTVAQEDVARAQIARPSDPTVIAPEQIPGLVRKLPDYAGFGYSGAAYFQGKLYVSSNIGLLVLKDHRIEALLQWTKSDAVIEGPWLDEANQSLWVQAATDASLLRFDGMQWTRMALPKPPAGFYTRGDMLTGFSGRSTSHMFWVVGGNSVWRWQPDDSTWSFEPLPPMPDGSAMLAYFNWGDNPTYLARDGYAKGFETENNTATVYRLLQREWQTYKGRNVNARDTVQTELSGFVRGETGELFAVTPEQMTVMETPGPCDAITRTTNGTLLASFGAAGVYEYVENKWTLRVSSPFPADAAEHWTHLAESDGEITLATSQVPQLVSGTDKFVHSGTAGIWITVKGKFQRVDGSK